MWRVLGTFSMCFTQPITTRFLVWLAAIAIPFQSVPSTACGCVRTSELTVVAVASSCCQPEPSCCSSESLTGTAACQCADSCDGGCQCGDNCQCGKSSLPRSPVVPPVENNSPDRIATDSTSVASLSVVFQPSFSRQHLIFDAGAKSLTALDSCARLCRFTL